MNADYQNAVLPMMIHRLSKKDPQAAMDYIRHAPSNIRQYTALFATTTGSPADTLEQMKWLDEEMAADRDNAPDEIWERPQ